MQKSLHVYIYPRHRYTEHLLQRKLDSAHDIMRNFRYAQPVFENDIYIYYESLIDNADVYPLVTLFKRKQNSLSVMEARRCDSKHTIAFVSCLYRDAVNGIWEYLDFPERMRAGLWP